MVRSAIAGVFIALLCGSALARDTVELKKIGTAKGRNVKIVHGSSSFDAFAGEIRHEFRNGEGLGDLFEGLVLDTFCVEVTEYVTESFRRYDVTDDVGLVAAPPLGADKALAIGRMYALLLEMAGLGSFDNDAAAGFQVAVWDVVYDFDAGVGRDSLDVDTGDMITRETSGGLLGGGARAAAHLFFDAVADDGHEPAPLFGFHNDGHQDQIVPAPATAGLAGLGALAFRRRRRA